MSQAPGKSQCPVLEDRRLCAPHLPEEDPEPTTLTAPSGHYIWSQGVCAQHTLMAQRHTRAESVPSCSVLRGGAPSPGHQSSVLGLKERRRVSERVDGWKYPNSGAPPAPSVCQASCTHTSRLILVATMCCGRSHTPSPSSIHYAHALLSSRRDAQSSPEAGTVPETPDPGRARAATPKVPSILVWQDQKCSCPQS